MSLMLVAVGRNAVEAAIWVDALRAAGVDARSFEQSAGAALGAAEVFAARFPVFVPEGQIGLARSVIADLADGSVLAPIASGGGPSPGQILATAGAAILVIAALVAALKIVG